MANTITFKWATGNIEIAACAVLDMSATQLKALVKTATANAEEVKNQIADYIQSEINKLNPKSEYDKKMIAQYNKLISAACGERRQTAQEKAISRIMKNCSAAMADKYMGVIHDADMYCVLDGFRLVRYTAPLENFPAAAQTFDTNKAIGDKSRYNIKLALPTVKDLKADMKIAKLSGMDVNRIHVIIKGKRMDFGYDFGYGLPMVNAKWLIDMMEALPGAAAYAVDSINPNPVYFTDGENDGILLPIRKMKEYESAPVEEKPIEKPVEAAAPVVKEDPAVEVKTTENKPSAANVPTVKNLSQFKKAISAGYAFKIVKHYIKPELSGQIRKPNKVQTNAFYSVVQGEPNNPVSLANDGKGYYLNYGKAGDWDFKGDTIKMYASGNPVWEITFDLSYAVDTVEEEFLDWNPAVVREMLASGESAAFVDRVLADVDAIDKMEKSASADYAAPLAYSADVSAAQVDERACAVSSVIVVHPTVLRRSARHYRQLSARRRLSARHTIRVYHTEPDSTTHVSIMNNAFCLNSS